MPRIWLGHEIIIGRFVLLNFSLIYRIERSISNLCMPYTSRHEITTTAEACIQDFISNGGNEQYAIYHASPLTLKNSIASPIMEKDTDNHLMISLGVSPPLDLILIRPSGVNRLNNFLLWQVKGPNLNAVNNLSIFFLSTSAVKEQLQLISTFWSEFGLFDFIPIILDYHRKVWNSRITL